MMSVSGWRRACVGVGTLVVALGAADAQDLTWSTSLGYASGTYLFEERYHTWSLLNGLSLRAGRATITASLPVVAQNGTSISLVGGVPVPTGGPDHAAVARRQSGRPIRPRPGRRSSVMADALSAPIATLVSESVADSLTVAGTGAYAINIGDPMLGASVPAFQGDGLIRALDLGVYAKAPLGSVASGISTGAWDYGAGAGVTLAAGDAIFFADAAWWVFGDMPDLTLNNALLYSGSLGRRLGGEWSMLASVAASTRLAPSIDPPVSVGLALSRGLTRSASFNVGVSAGLTESASSFAAYAGWSTKLLGAK
jgi:hypothetical protein